MTPTQSLSDRMREKRMFFRNGGTWCMSPNRDPDCQEAADALDAKDAEIASLKQIIQDLHYEMRDEAARNE